MHLYSEVDAAHVSRDAENWQPTANIDTLLITRYTSLLFVRNRELNASCLSPDMALCQSPEG
jgi:hypothetical protein